jgi:hypothetical protein
VLFWLNYKHLDLKILENIRFKVYVNGRTQLVQYNLPWRVWWNKLKTRKVLKRTAKVVMAIVMIGMWR